ncbi:MAG: BNR repeat-containing protein [Armatimonadetes bacterium]|nr:BNR repeat-containing protein [Armatimonadota bacterium]
MLSRTWPAAQETHQANTLFHFPLPEGGADVVLRVTDARGVVVIPAYYLADSVERLPDGLGKEELKPVLSAASAASREKADSPARQPTRAGAGFRGIWFSLGKKFKHGDKYSGGLGTYTANHVPMAVYAPAAQKTFFVYGGTSAADEQRLQAMISFYDHQTGRVARPVIVHEKQDVNDPHDNPSLNLDDKGHVWVFVSGRGQVRPGLIYRSARPHSIDGFELIKTGEFTYPQPWFESGRGFFHLLTKYRGAAAGAQSARELYWSTTPNGKTWSDDQKLAGFGGHYQVSAQHGGKIGTFFNYHPRGDVDKRTNLYYAQTTDWGKTWTTAEGKPLELPLTIPKNAALVLDLEAQNELMYGCDLNWDKEGNPVLLYVASRHGDPGAQGDPREVRVAHFDGQTWRHHRVTGCDHNYDMGSLWVQDNRWRVIGPFLPGPQKGQTGGEMGVWESSDAGNTWKLQKQITIDSPRNHSYARRPAVAHDGFYAFWADGDPNRLSESRLYFSDAGGKVFRLPYDMAESTARPEAVEP